MAHHSAEVSAILPGDDSASTWLGPGLGLLVVVNFLLCLSLGIKHDGELKELGLSTTRRVATWVAPCNTIQVHEFMGVFPSGGVWNERIEPVANSRGN